MGNKLIVLDSESERLIQPLLEKNEFSEWIRDIIKKELKDKETLQLEIKKLEETIKIKEKQVKLLEKYEKLAENDKKQDIFEEMPVLEQRWWKETIDLLEKDQTFIDGRKNLYNNEFNQRLNKVEFLEHYEKIKKVVKNEKSKDNTK